MHWRGSLNNQEDQGLGAVDERDEGSFRFSLVNHAAAQFQIGVVIILILMCIAVSFLYQLALLHRMGILYTFQLNQHRKYAR